MRGRGAIRYAVLLESRKKLDPWLEQAVSSKIDDELEELREDAEDLFDLSDSECEELAQDYIVQDGHLVFRLLAPENIYRRATSDQQPLPEEEEGGDVNGPAAS